MVKKWTDRVLTFLIIFIFLTVAYVVVSAKVTGSEPRMFGYQMLTVLSGSMEPAIQTGSIIFIRPEVDPTSLAEGDVITYRAMDDPGMFITHRITEIQRGQEQIQFMTKGDNNPSMDPTPIPVDHVVGKYAQLTIPWAGYVFSFLQSRAGIALMLIVPGLALILYQWVSVWKAITREQTEKKKQNEA